MNHSPTNVKVLRLVRERKNDAGAITTILRITLETVGSREVKWWLDGYKEKWKEEEGESSLEELSEKFIMTNT